MSKNTINNSVKMVFFFTIHDYEKSTHEFINKQRNDEKKEILCKKKEFFVCNSTAILIMYQKPSEYR